MGGDAPTVAAVANAVRRQPTAVVVSSMTPAAKARGEVQRGVIGAVPPSATRAPHSPRPGAAVRADRLPPPISRAP